MRCLIKPEVEIRTLHNFQQLFLLSLRKGLQSLVTIGSITTKLQYKYDGPKFADPSMAAVSPWFKRSMIYIYIYINPYVHQYIFKIIIQTRHTQARALEGIYIPTIKHRFNRITKKPADLIKVCIHMCTSKMLRSVIRCSFTVKAKHFTRSQNPK